MFPGVPATCYESPLDVFPCGEYDFSGMLVASFWAIRNAFSGDDPKDLWNAGKKVSGGLSEDRESSDFP